MRTILAGIVMAGGLAGGAAAQETPSPDALTINVRPSGIDHRTEEGQAREERLQRRMQENEYLFRNICTGCGGSVSRLVGINAPFDPAAVLAKRGSKR